MPSILMVDSYLKTIYTQIQGMLVEIVFSNMSSNSNKSYNYSQLVSKRETGWQKDISKNFIALVWNRDNEIERDLKIYSSSSRKSTSKISEYDSGDLEKKTVPWLHLFQLQ